MANLRSKSRQLLLIFTSIYFIYSILWSGNNGDTGPFRLLSEQTSLEYVHISHTGGDQIEAMASTQASINWGACHFIQVPKRNCLDPDMSWYNISAEENRHTYALSNIWLTPPAILADFIDEPNRNPYSNKELFTVVRNPYAKVVSEFYCSSNGYNENRDKSDTNDPAALNAWVSAELHKFMDQLLRHQQIDGDELLMNATYATNSFSQLFKKRFTPMFRYVYDNEGQRVIGNVLHFEDIRSEFNSLMEKYEVDIKMPTQIKESGGKLTHLDLYPETISLINSLFEPDFEAFGYEMVESFSGRAAYSLRSRSKPCSKYTYGDQDCRRDEKTKVQIKKPTVSTQLPRASTFMLGIFTEMTEEGARTRERIRNTYLQNTENSTLLCSWETYKNQVDSSGGRWVPCRIPYAFVVGGDQSRTKWQVDDMPIVIERNRVKSAALSVETDILYLNVKEGEESKGRIEKTFAYFKFASIFGPEYHIDFVASVKTDTLIDMGRLIDFIDKELPPSPISRGIYGGETYGHLAGYYATDPFYFVSIDLTNYISKYNVKNLNSQSKTAALEISKLLSFHKKPISYINMNAHLFWYKEIFDSNTWDEHWKLKMTALPRRKPALETLQICKDFEENTLSA